MAAVGFSSAQSWSKIHLLAVIYPETGSKSSISGRRLTKVATVPDDWIALAMASWNPAVRIWPAIATLEMLCDKLTANMSHNQWREWISADIEYVELCPGLPIPGD